MFSIAGLLGALMLGASVGLEGLSDSASDEARTEEDDAADSPRSAGDLLSEGSDSAPTPADLLSDMVLIGGAEDDILDGAEGDDILLGAEGNDMLDGAGGADRIEGDFGADSLAGGDGDDDLAGQADDDALKGGPGNDLLIGGPGNDLIDGEEGDDGLMGGYGDDLIEGGTGADVLNGNEGDDRLSGLAAPDAPGPAEDDGARDYLNGGTGADMLIGGAGDNLNGGEDADDFVVGDWIVGADSPAQIEDFDAAEDHLVVVYDDAAHPEPEIGIESTAEGGATLTLDGEDLAEIETAAGLTAASVVLVPESQVAAFGWPGLGGAGAPG